jgi:hypothetical protein
VYFSGLSLAIICIFYLCRQLIQREELESTKGCSPPLVPLNLVSKSVASVKPLAMQDHILDLSKKRNTTYYDQINLIKEHTSTKDDLSKVAEMLQSKYNTENSMHNDLIQGPSESMTRKILSGQDVTKSTHSVEEKPETSEINKSTAAEMQISPNVVGMGTNREGVLEEGNDSIWRPSTASPENGLVNVVDDGSASETDNDDNMPLSLFKTAS